MRKSVALLSVLAFVAFPMAQVARAQQVAPSPQPSAQPSASPAAAPGAAPINVTTLTPAQQAAVRLAIIKLSQNPVGNITVLPFQQNFNYGVGPYTRFQYNLNVQPVLPIMLSKNMNLISRTIIPVLVQPSFAPPTACATAAGCGSTFGISDVQEQLYFAPKTKPDALIWGVGPIFQFPTASPDTLGAGKWSTGLDAVALVTPGKWVIGALVSQMWSFAGQANRPNVSAFLVQPFANLNLSDGWALTSGPIITANWVATSNRWTVPLGGGVAKTFKAGDQLMQITALYYSAVARPLTAPQTNLRVVWSLLWPVKRGIDIGELIKENQ
ncbi:MAG: hypothetical protein WA629_07880 [Candidatus Aquilonibacter sp.]